MVHAQTFTVALIVLGSAVYASWSLMPTGLRQRLAAALLRWRLPAWCQTRLRRSTNAASGACGGCDGCAGKKPPAVVDTEPGARPVVFHRRII